MEKYLSEFAKRLTPYIPGEQPKNNQLIKLNTNENPFPPSPKAIRAMKKALNENLRLYPAPECEVIRDAIVHTEKPDRQRLCIRRKRFGRNTGVLFCGIFRREKSPAIPGYHIFILPRILQDVRHQI